MTSSILLLLASQAFFAQSNAVARTERALPDGVGYHIARLNDVDGDHCADFALDDGDEWVWVVSGKSGGVISRLHSAGAPSIRGLGCDVDSDGVFDLVVFDSKGNTGASIRSGRSLEVIRQLEPKDKSAAIRLGPIAVGDRDGDGVPDVVVADYHANPTGLLVFSGKTGKELERIPGREGCALGPLACGDMDRVGKCKIAVVKSQTIWSILHPEDRAEMLMYGHDPAAHLGSIADKGHRLDFGACVFVPDVEGDGRDDLLVAQEDHCLDGTKDADSPAAAAHQDASGLVVYSTRTLLPTRELGKCGGFVRYSDTVSLARLGDLDGDGVADVGAAFDHSMQGFALVFSGKTGALIRTHTPEVTALGVSNLPDPGHFAVSMFGLGDTDGDGVGDYAIGSSGGADGLGVGCVSVYSGKSGKLLRVIWKRDLVKK